MILETCISTEMPPKPSKKAAMQISVIVASTLMLVNVFNPLVTSSIPFKTLIVYTSDMLNTSNKGATKCTTYVKKPIFSKILLNTAKNII